MLGRLLASFGCPKVSPRATVTRSHARALSAAFHVDRHVARLVSSDQTVPVHLYPVRPGVGDAEGYFAGESPGRSLIIVGGGSGWKSTHAGSSGGLVDGQD